MPDSHQNPEANLFADERARMVEKQIKARGVADPRVLDAMRRTPRHCFVHSDLEERAYDDHPLDIGCGQTISQPYMVAIMTSLLMLQAGDKVLEIGTGSGYQAALLSLLAGHVYSVERIEALADPARDRLRRLGYDNVTVVVGDGTMGYHMAAPYDAIMVTAGGPSVPRELEAQLGDGGRLVCPVGSRNYQTLIRVTRNGDKFAREKSIGCIFVPLIGEDGWRPEE